MSVTVQEVVEAMLFGCSAFPDVALAERIEREGIEPPEGYAIVPIEPTNSMLAEIVAWMPGRWENGVSVDLNHAQVLYHAMLTAAPKPEGL